MKGTSFAKARRTSFAKASGVTPFAKASEDKKNPANFGKIIILQENVMIFQDPLNSLTKIICLITILVFFTTIFNCSNKIDGINDPLERNLVLSGTNRQELEKVITHFKRDPDSLKLKATIFLLSNMEDNFHFSGEWLTQMDTLFFNRVGDQKEEGIQKLRDSVYQLIGHPDPSHVRKNYDLKKLSSGFLIQNIEEAYSSWQQAPWRNTVSFDAFCNYILPYKVFDEYPEEWRTKLKARYGYIRDDPHIPNTMEDISCAMVDEQKKWLKFSAEPLGYPSALNIRLIQKLKRGTCVEWSAYAAQAARAFGIPVAIDYVPQYGNLFSDHKWDALIMSDSHSVSFIGAESRPGDHASIREGEVKYAKVFRLQLNINPESFAVKAQKNGIHEIPQYLEDPRIKDVTSLYTLVADLKLSITGKSHQTSPRPLYLCVFKNWNWEAVAGGLIEQGVAWFPSMGRAILYMPMYYDHGKYQAAGPPIVLTAENKIKTYQAGDKGKMVLTRKYPFKRTEEWLHENALLSAWFEGANDPEFQHPRLLNWIDRNIRPYRASRVNNLAIKDQWVYDSLWREIPVRTHDPFRYLRLVIRKENPFRLGEIEFYTSSQSLPLTGKYIGNVPQPSLAFDGFPGKCIKLPVDTSVIRWVGVDLGKKMSLDKIRFIPADDDNFVESGKSYELFYWKNKWVSAGSRQAESDSLEYSDVPQGSIYFLRCRNCDNRDERPFTYEDGKQIWW